MQKLYIIFICLEYATSASVPLSSLLKQSGITVYSDGNFSQITGVKISDSNYDHGKLTEHNIPQTNGNLDYLVLLYSARCIHCHTFIATVYKDIKPRLDECEFQVIGSALQCNQNPQTCQKLNIAAYPTLYYFTKTGKMYIFPRQISRTMQNILEFVNKSHNEQQMHQSTKKQQFKPGLTIIEEHGNLQAQKQVEIQTQKQVNKQTQIAPSNDDQNAIKDDHQKTVQDDDNENVIKDGDQSTIEEDDDFPVQKKDKYHGYTVLKIIIISALIICMIDRFLFHRSNKYRVQQRNSQKQQLFQKVGENSRRKEIVDFVHDSDEFQENTEEINNQQEIENQDEVPSNDNQLQILEESTTQVKAGQQQGGLQQLYDDFD